MTVSDPGTLPAMRDGHAPARDRRLPRIAYFCMEIALDPGLPTYSGGLGILAGDLLLAAADLALPMIGVTLVHRQGYFVQHLDASGRQTESLDAWDPATRLASLPAPLDVAIEGRTVRVRAWQYDLRGQGGHIVPIYLLDTDVDGNEPHDRALTGALYGGDSRYRLAQEAILGYGGYALLEALGVANAVRSIHMNEGHSALLVAAALERRLAGRSAHEATADELAELRNRFVFTTHTPVPAGHDRFDIGLVRSVIGGERAHVVEVAGGVRDGTVNMTQLALRGSHFTNGVAMRHGETSRALFPGEQIGAISNGVHAVRWTSPAFRALFDRRFPDWRRDNDYLRHAVGIPLDDILIAHRVAKETLADRVRRSTGVSLDTARLTIGFARRAATYKRAYLAFLDPERLSAIAERAGPLQFVFAGKAHPNDAEGKHMIARVFEASARLGDRVRAVYLENYEMSLAQTLVAGVDLWLNTPQPPLEASGTSGMKAALNGVPSFSTLDGWWVEGCIEGVTGWSIGNGATVDDAADAAAFYEKLEHMIAPLYYGRPDWYARVMRGAIALNGSYFTAQRALEQYVRSAYAPPST